MPTNKVLFLWKYLCSNTFREKAHQVIFEAETPAGKLFDVALLIAIVTSVMVVLLETVKSYNQDYWRIFYILEWIFTILFTLEYAMRLYVVHKPLRYSTSFYGIVDLLSILPTYLSLFFMGAQSLLVIRILRLLRVFRIFKLWQFIKEANHLATALFRSRVKISVFLLFIVLLVTIIGALIYLIEGEQPDTDFTSIPKSIYWAIVTMTTVGYGDITPKTTLGQFLSAIVMILGYAVIAVPTGIVSVEMFRTPDKKPSTDYCRYCGREGHDADAVFCKYCSKKLNEPANRETN